MIKQNPNFLSILFHQKLNIDILTKQATEYYNNFFKSIYNKFLYPPKHWQIVNIIAKLKYCFAIQKNLFSKKTLKSYFLSFSPPSSPFLHYLHIHQVYIFMRLF